MENKNNPIFLSLGISILLLLPQNLSYEQLQKFSNTSTR